MTDPLIEKEEQTSCWNSDDPEHCKKLPAEIKFDKAVYGGISYWAQAITGILLAKWLRHGGGRPYFDKAVKWVAPNFIEKISSKRGQAAIEAADYWITVSTMVNVGNLFLLPVKWLEDRKPKFVRRINERMNRKREECGESISPEERAEQEAHLQALEKAPKQTWPSLLIGRGFGLGVVYTAMPLIGNNNKIMENFSVKAVQNVVGTAGLKSLAQSKTFENYARISFYDLVYSAFSAGGLYIYSHLIHPKKPRVVEFDKPADAAVHKKNEKAVEIDHKPSKSLSKKLEKPPVRYTQKISAEESAGNMQPML